MAGKSSCQSIEGGEAILAGSGDVAADTTKDGCSTGTSKRTRDLLFHLGHAQVTFSLIVGERDTKIVHEGKHRAPIIAEAFHKVACLGLPLTPTAVGGTALTRIAPQGPGKQAVILLFESVECRSP